MGWWIQRAEISFRCKVSGLSLRDRVRSSDIQEEEENHRSFMMIGVS